ncbi:MAG: hypothetical protein ABIG31_02735 [Candidatus Omnitrophota bacterium]
MGKVRYEIDPHNRLVANSQLRGLRKVYDGQFRISSHNTLTYHVKTALPRDSQAPHQIKLKGTWSLTPDYDLRLTLDKWRRQTFGDQLTIRTEFIDAKKNSLVFGVGARTKNGSSSLYILELAGTWQADERNRLAFQVEKERQGFDVLTFDGSWQIDKNYQIIYRYQKKNLARDRKKTHTLAFQGCWDIRDKARLSYSIDKNTSSAFDFKTSLGVFRERSIKYELGIGLSRRKAPVKRAITFFGRWRIHKAKTLIFEVERGGGRIQAIVLGAEAKLTDKGTVSFKLRSKLNRDIGCELELSRDIFKGRVQALLRLLTSGQESAILLGVGLLNPKSQIPNSKTASRQNPES